MVEAAVAAREAKEPLSADPEREMEQGAANGDGEHYVKGNPNETRSKVSSAATIDHFCYNFVENHHMSGRRNPRDYLF